MALCLSAASAAPQQLIRTFSTAPAAIHAVGTPTLLHASHAPTVVRTIAAPTVVSHAAVPATTVVRTNAAYAAPAVIEEEEVVEEAEANYQFGYSVADEASGDSKTRSETRNGDYVSGSYSVADPDGRVRVVEYTADAENGFQVKRSAKAEISPEIN